MIVSDGLALVAMMAALLFAMVYLQTEKSAADVPRRPSRHTDESV